MCICACVCACATCGCCCVWCVVVCGVFLLVLVLARACISFMLRLGRHMRSVRSHRGGCLAHATALPSVPCTSADASTTACRTDSPKCVLTRHRAVICLGTATLGHRGSRRPAGHMRRRGPNQGGLPVAQGRPSAKRSRPPCCKRPLLPWRAP